MKTAFHLFLGFFFVITAQAQELSPSVISSGGEVTKTPGISLEWTLGEFAVETISAGKKIYTQGFHQPILNVRSFHSPPSFESSKKHTGFNILVSPNPTQSFINIHVQAEANEQHNFCLFDMNGRKVLSMQAKGHSYVLRMELGRLSGGVYLLDIRDKNGKMIEAFKIVKAD
jgi:hypothetical protein